MRRALALARRALGETSPNPMVGAVLVRGGRILGEGWHHRAGGAHAEIEAMRDAEQRGERIRGATLYVTLEPCSTQGRTPPCTEAILRRGIRKVVVAASDPNPKHAGRGFQLLRDQGVEVVEGILAEDATRLNGGFNHWIQTGRPLVTLKVAMSLDGRIATETGESKWLTGPRARARVQGLRRAHDAILVGIGTVLADDPSLTLREPGRSGCRLRVILDTRARIPAGSKVLTDAFRDRTVVVVGRGAPARRLKELARHVDVWVAPLRRGRVSLPWLIRRLGHREVTSLLVEGGGEVHATFLRERLAHRVALFYAPKILLGWNAPRAVGGVGFGSRASMPELDDLKWTRVGLDLLLEARIAYPSPRPRGGG
ncbi:MAG: bifunctional diaminohydroxyphosphoribosylaminopyrimidine deaminase/5-amino-6-(5-phosphoribosylamino)uracil reductase RibD [Verrucomicrobiales bacterium]|nr:bifunctional diaminohydroxyphosphoribosylaminopyrimidine deaminase/5-amino-6-(5-phosphoribosylamino)uracil reductase RibD [Verrucomicrobiales bacterium]